MYVETTRIDKVVELWCFVQILCSYFRYTGRLFLVCALFFFFLLCVILSYYQSFMKNQEGIKIELQKEVHRRICVRDITFFNAVPSFHVIFYCFLWLLPFPSDILAEWSLSRYIILLWVEFCVMSKILKSLAI